jgi:hypothetical protein
MKCQSENLQSADLKSIAYQNLHGNFAVVVLPSAVAFFAGRLIASPLACLSMSY